MDITTAGIFFVGTILYGMGIIILAAVLLIINNLFSKFWKPIDFLRITDYPPKENNTEFVDNNQK